MDFLQLIMEAHEDVSDTGKADSAKLGEKYIYVCIYCDKRKSFELLKNAKLHAPQLFSFNYIKQ